MTTTDPYVTDAHTGRERPAGAGLQLFVRVFKVRCVIIGRL